MKSAALFFNEVSWITIELFPALGVCLASFRPHLAGGMLCLLACSQLFQQTPACQRKSKVYPPQNVIVAIIHDKYYLF